jgi:hypothetical protein
MVVMEKPTIAPAINSLLDRECTMIEIAGGIILAVLILFLLPYIAVGLRFAVGVALVLAIACGAAWMVWTGSQSASGLAAELIIGGVFLIWLSYEVKARRLTAAERAAQITPSEHQ